MSKKIIDEIKSWTIAFLVVTSAAYSLSWAIESTNYCWTKSLVEVNISHWLMWRPSDGHLYVYDPCDKMGAFNEMVEKNEQN